MTAPARAAAQATPEAALRPAAPAPSEDVQPAAPAPAPAPGIDIDAVHHVRSAAAEPGPIEALPPGEIVELAPAAPAADLPMVAAWCSDGTYVIEARGARIDLTAAEALELWEHLTACRVPLGSAAA
ncbi:hypothetical protein ABXN37_19770 [Piscinibacter sakaiensis]|uniref:hypothetical protein n=1 Tax=Piscinibacter sakaiensis TaxID=1547922 RepID=UPI0037281827